jgi:hypothetical protein
MRAAAPPLTADAWRHAHVCGLVRSTCHLLPLELAHADALWESVFRDLPASHWAYLPYTLDSKDALLRWLRPYAASSDPLFFVIADPATGACLGLAAYLRIFSTEGTIEVRARSMFEWVRRPPAQVGHLSYGPALKRTTASTEAMFLMARKAFQLGFRRYEVCAA